MSVNSAPVYDENHNLINSLNFIYEAIRLPMYLYRKGALTAVWPEEHREFCPPEMYLSHLRANDFSTPYIPTDFAAFYGMLPLTENTLMIGPVSQLAYTRNDLHRIFSEYRISSTGQDSAIYFFQSIPRHEPRDFGRILAMIHHFLNPDFAMDFTLDLKNQLSEEVLASSIQNVYEQASINQRNNSLEHEQYLIDIVEHGRLEQLSEIRFFFSGLNAGTVASTPMRNQKDLQIALITLLTRAAIRGGMEDQLAFQLSDQYIQNIERAALPQELSDIASDAVLSFTTQVAHAQKAHPVNSDFDQVIRYIRAHLSEPLTEAEIARIFGYNASYLSTSFKKELGFGLSSFIYRARLEEARQLLAFTNKSLLEISEYLCFSDQSHFQRKFKQQYGMTPLQYRKQNYKGSYK